MKKQAPTPDDLLNDKTPASDDLLGGDDDLLLDIDAEVEPDMAEGVYPAKVVEVETTESSSGNKQLKFTFQVYGGRKVVKWTSLTPQARWRLIKDLKALGVEPVGERISIKKDQLIGVGAYLVMKNRTYNGETRIQVDDLKPMSPDEQNALEKEHSDVPVI